MEIEQRVAAFESQAIDAGLTLFQEFFLVAMAVSLVALLPAALMAKRPGRRRRDAEGKVPLCGEP